MSKRFAVGLAVIAAIAAAVPAAAAPPRVSMMVVGRIGALSGARQIKLAAGTVTIGHRRCRVPAGTALAGLLAAHLPIKVSDQGGCDPASMFVTGIRGERNRGPAGWEYKVAHADPSFGAGDPGGRLRPGRQLLWYWCVRADDCQRTLSIGSSFADSSLHVRVIGYDQSGHGQPVGGATVHYGAATASTDAQGRASFTLTRGVHQLYAMKPGLVRSFPTTVGVVP